MKREKVREQESRKERDKIERVNKRESIKESEKTKGKKKM